MTFKNTIKLVVSNFSSFWKLMFCYFVAIVMVGALWAPISVKTIDAFSTAGVFEILKNFLVDFHIGDFPNLFSNLLLFANAFLQAISLMLGANLFCGIYFCFLLLFILPFVFNLCELAICEGLYGYMSSLTRYGFASLYIKGFGKSVVLSLVKTLIMLPINFAFLVSCYFALSVLHGSEIMLAVMPLVFSLAICLGPSIKTSVFGCWVPGMVVMGYKNPFSALSKGVKICGNKFLTALSCSLVITVVCYLLSLLFGLYILIITVPLGAFLMLTLNMVTYYETRGMRYYVDRQTIISPKKLEEVDNFKKLKAIL